MKVKNEKYVGVLEAISLWKLYREIFEKLSEDAPVRQMLYFHEWMKLMLTPRGKKIVLRDEKGAVVSMGVYGTKLSDFPFLSLKFFEKRFPECYAQGRLFYFIALLTRPGMQGEGHAAELFEAMTHAVADVEGIAIFDVCSGNATSGLPEVIHKMGSPYAELEPLVELGIERYCAIITH